MTNAPLDWPAFAALLKRYTFGDWWDRIKPHTPDPQWGACEACEYHPLTAEQGRLIDLVLATVKENGGPAPVAVYPHCAGDVFFEWHSQDDAGKYRVVFDLKTWDALVSSGDTDFTTYFVNLPPLTVKPVVTIE